MITPLQTASGGDPARGEPDYKRDGQPDLWLGGLISLTKTRRKSFNCKPRYRLAGGEVHGSVRTAFQLKKRVIRTVGVMATAPPVATKVHRRRHQPGGAEDRPAKE